MNHLEELTMQRRSSLLIVCTLGLAGLFMESIRPVWMTDLFEGTSLENNGGVAFVLKAISFLFLGAVTAALLFIVHLVKVIVYSVQISRLS